MVGECGGDAELDRIGRQRRAGVEHDRAPAFESEQGRLGASFVYPNGAAEAMDWVERILKKGEKPPKKITLGTDEINTANAKAMCEKYDCEATK